MNADGSPYRMPANGIRSTTATGKHSRFPRKMIQAAIEIDGDNLHDFHHAAQAYLDGDPCPTPFQWAFDACEAIRTGRGPNSGEQIAQHRALMARDQASMMLDLAKRSGAPGFVIPTTYRESPAGRLYAEGPINLQRCVGEVRKTALRGCYDVDIANCHWSLLVQMAERLDEPAPHILHYWPIRRRPGRKLPALAVLASTMPSFCCWPSSTAHRWHAAPRRTSAPSRSVWVTRPPSDCARCPWCLICSVMFVASVRLC